VDIVGILFAMLFKEILIVGFSVERFVIGDEYHLGGLLNEKSRRLYFNA